MKTIRLAIGLIVLITFVSATTTLPAQGKFGAGIVFGEPTGFAWKYRINVDYLWQSHPFQEPKLSLHYGPGAALGFGRTNYIYVDRGNGYIFRSQELGFGIRGVVGLTYLVPKTPMDLFFEVAPVMILAPGAGTGIDVGFGARFYP